MILRIRASRSFCTCEVGHGLRLVTFASLQHELHLVRRSVSSHRVRVQMRWSRGASDRDSGSPPAGSSLAAWHRAPNPETLAPRVVERRPRIRERERTSVYSAREIEPRRRPSAWRAVATRSITTSIGSARTARHR